MRQLSYCSTVTCNCKVGVAYMRLIFLRLGFVEILYCAYLRKGGDMSVTRLLVLHELHELTVRQNRHAPTFILSTATQLSGSLCILYSEYFSMSLLV